MKDGVVNQIDSPINLYNKPVDKFVAGFIGSPSMNFIEGTFTNEPNPKFESNNRELIIPIHGIDQNEFSNNTVIAGIRPEDIHTQRGNLSNTTSVKVGLDLVEQMGNEALAYFQVERNQFVARFPASYPTKTNKQVQIFIDVSKIHYFDRESSLNIFS